MMVFDREGNFLRSWGEGQYPRAHGVHMAPDDTMFLTDDGGHFVRKVTLDGKVLRELGIPGKPALYISISAASRFIAAPTQRSRRRARSTSPTATAIPAPTNIRPTAN